MKKTGQKFPVVGRCSRLLVVRLMRNSYTRVDRTVIKSSGNSKKRRKDPFECYVRCRLRCLHIIIISNPISFGLLRDQTAAHRASSIVVYRVQHTQLFLRVGSLLTRRPVKEMRQKNGRTCHNYIFKIRFSRIRITVYLHNGSTMMIDQPRFS